jgi:hypothetical protein
MQLNSLQGVAVAGQGAQQAGGLAQLVQHDGGFDGGSSAVDLRLARDEEPAQEGTHRRVVGEELGEHIQQLRGGAKNTHGHGYLGEGIMGPHRCYRHNLRVLLLHAQSTSRPISQKRRQNK